MRACLEPDNSFHIHTINSRQFVQCTSTRIGQLQGVMSKIVKVEIQWSEPAAASDNPPKSVVLKIPSPSTAGETLDADENLARFKEAMNTDRNRVLEMVS